MGGGGGGGEGQAPGPDALAWSLPRWPPRLGTERCDELCALQLVLETEFSTRTSSSRGPSLVGRAKQRLHHARGPRRIMHIMHPTWIVSPVLEVIIT